jgi:diguanylate cyclase (GGDEF)-like protein/PAS domain S-box-containing protein
MPAPSVIETDNELLSEAFDRAAIGIAFVAGDGRIVRANPALCRIVGYAENELVALGWEAITHRDDLAADFAQARQLLDGEIRSYEIEKRYIHKSGHTVWTRLTASTLGDGATPLFLAQVQEITQFKRSEQAASAANIRLAELIEHLGAGILVEDDRRKIRLANATFCRLLELQATPTHLAGRHGEAFGCEIAKLARDPAEFELRLAELRARRAETRRERLALSDGRTLERDFVPLESHGEPRGQMWVYRDVTNRVEAEKFNHEQNSRLEESNGRLAALASTDALTGLPNRRSLHERLVDALRQSGKDGRSVSLSLLDVDRFKDFNDRFGHPAGDEVLRALAGLFRQVVRIGDVAARFGGEEFAILMPRTGRAEALRVAERCRHALERAAWPHRPVTASFGVATVTSSTTDEDAAAHVLIAAADSALYRSKAAGRNRVTHAEDPFAT